MNILILLFYLLSTGMLLRLLINSLLVRPVNIAVIHLGSILLSILVLFFAAVHFELQIVSAILLGMTGLVLLSSGPGFTGNENGTQKLLVNSTIMAMMLLSWGLAYILAHAA